MKGLVAAGLAAEVRSVACELIAVAEAAAMLTKDVPPGWLGDSVLRRGLGVAVPE